jgi:hypothetical protein
VSHCCRRSSREFDLGGATASGSDPDDVDEPVRSVSSGGVSARSRELSAGTYLNGGCCIKNPRRLLRAPGQGARRVGARTRRSATTAGGRFHPCSKPSRRSSVARGASVKIRERRVRSWSRRTGTQSVCPLREVNQCERRRGTHPSAEGCHPVGQPAEPFGSGGDERPAEEQFLPDADEGGS